MTKRKKQQILLSIVLLLVYLVTGPLKEQRRENRIAKNKKIKAENLGARKKVFSKSYKIEVSEKLKKEVLEVFQEEYPEDKFYYRVEPSKIDDYFLSEDGPRYEAVVTSEKLDLADRPIYLRLKTEDSAREKTSSDEYKITKEYRNLGRMLDVYAKMGKILNETFGEGTDFSFQYNGGLSPRHYWRIENGIARDPEDDTERPSNYVPGISTQGIFISLVVDDATKVDPEKIKKQMLLYGERIVKEMSTKGNVYLYIMDKGNYSKNNIINRMEIVSLKDKRLQEAMSHWEEEETKDLAYVSKFIPRAWQKKFWYVQYSVTKNGKEKGVDITFFDYTVKNGPRKMQEF